jgi:hypothetical protein
MSPNPWLIPVVTGLALAIVYVLPKASEMADSAALMELPEASGDWWLEPQPASMEEIGTLGAETAFAKATCLRPRPGEFTGIGRRVYDLIDLSIVLSGSDLNTSIHRPERCMPAQGHLITASADVVLRTHAGHEFKAKRLRSVKTLPGAERGVPGRRVECVTYYFFVGHDRITNDHLERTLVDMKDRLLRGMDQRWAYVSATAMFGELPWTGKPVSEEEADAGIREFLSELADEQIDWSRVNG